MKKNFSVGRIIYVIALCMIIIPACDLRKDYSNILYYLGIVLLLFKALISFIPNMRFKLKRNQVRVVGIWILLLLTLLPGFAVNNYGLEVIIENAFTFILYFILLANSDMEIEDIIIASVISNLYFAYRCFFEIGIVQALYQGIATNPNQMSLVLVGGIIASLYLIVNCRLIGKIAGFFSLAISLILVFFTSCRSVMLISVAAIVLYLLYYFKEVKNADIFSNRKIEKKTFIIWLCLVCGCIIVVFTLWDNIIAFLFEKWGYGVTTVLSGRNDLWNIIINNISFTGKNSSEINANNDYFDWLMKYGILSFIVYIYLLFFCVRVIWGNYKVNKQDNIWEIIIIILYLAICFVENIHATFGKSINIMFWFTLGTIMRTSINKNQNKYQIGTNECSDDAE